jgi:hypothetical protein
MFLKFCLPLGPILGERKSTTLIAFEEHSTHSFCKFDEMRFEVTKPEGEVPWLNTSDIPSGVRAILTHSFKVSDSISLLVKVILDEI